MTDKLPVALKQLQAIDRATKVRARSQPRFHLMDGHGTRRGLEMVRYVIKNNMG